MTAGIRRLGLGIALALAPLAVDPPSARAADWASHAGRDTVEVVTIDADGSTRVTKIWLIVVGDQGYIRTGSTRWGANVERNPDLALRIGEAELPFTAEFVTDAAVRAGIQAAYREKYGFADWLSGLVRGGNPKIMRLLAREADAPAP